MTRAVQIGEELEINLLRGCEGALLANAPVRLRLRGDA